MGAECASLPGSRGWACSQVWCDKVDTDGGILGWEKMSERGKTEQCGGWVLTKHRTMALARTHSCAEKTWLPTSIRDSWMRPSAGRAHGLGAPPVCEARPSQRASLSSWWSNIWWVGKIPGKGFKSRTLSWIVTCDSRNNIVLERNVLSHHALAFIKSC